MIYFYWSRLCHEHTFKFYGAVLLLLLIVESLIIKATGFSGETASRILGGS